MLCNFKKGSCTAKRAGKKSCSGSHVENNRASAFSYPGPVLLDF